VGEGVMRKSDFRIVSATHQDLQTAVEKSRFRPDLYYRLSAITLQVPPLRERPEDIPMLLEHFAQQLGSNFRLDPATLAFLCARPWPGNVRELRNAVERLVTLGPGSLMEQKNGAGPEKDFHQAREVALEVFEKSYLESLLIQCRGSISGAARKAGVARSYFYELLAKHGLRRK
jgi:DNA-binding NtrC family response regulator